MTSSQQFSEFLRTRRESLGLGVSRFAELVGRSPSTIRSWERGRSRPGDPKAVSAIAAVLDVDEDTLAGLLAGGTIEVEAAPEPESTEPAWQPEPEPMVAAVTPGSGFFAPSEESPLESDRLRRVPWLPTPPGRSVVDRADRGVRYQLRMVGTVVAIVVLLLMLQWALGEFRVALSDLKLSVFGP